MSDAGLQTAPLTSLLMAPEAAPPVSLPPRQGRLPLLALLRTAQNNLLSVWPESAYRKESFGFRLFRQDYFVCNSPDLVRRVFLEEHSNYDRKSPQMRHALEPLLGDGLFVSDGDLWQERGSRKAGRSLARASPNPTGQDVGGNGPPDRAHHRPNRVWR
jgi:hypothetical protein